MSKTTVNEQNITCPLCKNNRGIITGKPEISTAAYQFIRHDYSVVQCANCGYYFVNPPIDFTGEEWQQLYNSSYFAEMTKWHQKQRIIDIQARFTKLKNYCTNDIKNFLDVGCGEGWGLIEAVKLGWNSYGIDISDNRVNEAKNGNINFTPGNLPDACYPDSFFDCIYMDSVLEHLIDPVSYLKEINRIMKRGGILYLGVPNEDSLFNNVKRILYRLKGDKISEKIKPFETPYHVGGFNQTSLPAAASKTDFKIVELRNFAAHFEFRKYTINSKNFWMHLFLLPVDILAILLRKEIYLEAYLKK
ncbi:MAG: class I SAM-dependent methyltransferase [Ignavibacteriaceae bacterium]|nr:class I SAM-dependent methyltransferase [Ignavibacteriaceae bacterium]